MLAVLNCCMLALQLLTVQADIQAQQEYERLYGTAPHGEWQLKAAPFSPAVLMLADENLGVIGKSRFGSEVF